MRSIVTLAAFFCTFRATAQEPSLYINADIGASHFFSRSGPGTFSEDKGIVFARPVVKMFGLSIIILRNKKIFYDAALSTQEFDWGYIPFATQSLGSFSSGLLGSAFGRPTLYRIGLGIGRRVVISRRWHFTASLGPSLGYYRYNSVLGDTASFNLGKRLSDSLNRDAPFDHFSYHRAAIQQRAGLYPFLNAQVSFELNLGRHHAIVSKVGYQQGFKPFVIDSMRITEIFRGGREGESKTFYTKVNGTSLPFSVGYSYRFLPGKKDAATKYREIPPGGGFRKKARR